MSTKSNESKLFDNKHLIHIVSEVVVIFGITFYFSSKNKKLTSNIEELSQKLEEKEDHIEKLEETVKQLSQKLDTVITQMNNGFNQMGQNINMVAQKFSSNGLSTPNTPSNDPKNKIKFIDPPRLSKNDKQQKTKTNQIFKKEEQKQPEDVEVNETSDQSEDESEDSELDEEIKAELEELNSLKKQT